MLEIVHRVSTMYDFNISKPDMNQEDNVCTDTVGRTYIATQRGKYSFE